MNWKQFWGICEHKWKIISRATKIRTRDNAEVGEILCLQCEKCGDIKEKHIGI